MKGAVPYVTIAVVVTLALGGYAFMQSGNLKSPTSSSSSGIFTFQDVGIAIPQGQKSCQPLGPLQCDSLTDAYLFGTVFASAGSPLSCIDVYVNGTSEGSSCWNLTATGFPYSECSGSGSNYSCTTGLRPNNNTQTTRTIPFSFQLLNGSDNTPHVMEGRPYLVTLVAQFQDGSSSTVSVTVVAYVVADSSMTPFTTSSFTTSLSE